METLITTVGVVTLGVAVSKMIDKAYDRIAFEIEQRRYFKAKEAEFSTKNQARRAFQCLK